MSSVLEELLLMHLILVHLRLVVLEEDVKFQLNYQSVKIILESVLLIVLKEKLKHWNIVVPLLEMFVVL